MYAFIDLQKRMFLVKEPDEPTSPTQRATLTRKIRSVAATYPEAVVSLVHIDDLTDETDWTCDTIVGPKGGAAKVEAAKEDISIDLPIELVRDLTRDLRRKLTDLQNAFTSDVAKLYAEHDRKLVGMLRAKAGKPKPPTVIEAGYDRDGHWHDVGPQTTKKKRK